MQPRDPGELAGHFAAARPLLEESLATASAAQNHRGIATALLNLGVTAYLTPDLAAAEAYLKQGIELCREMGLRRHLAPFSNLLGKVYADSARSLSAVAGVSGGAAGLARDQRSSCDSGDDASLRGDPQGARSGRRAHRPPRTWRFIPLANEARANPPPTSQRSSGSTLPPLRAHVQTSSSIPMTSGEQLCGSSSHSPPSNSCPRSTLPTSSTRRTSRECSRTCAHWTRLVALWKHVGGGHFPTGRSAQPGDV